MFFEKIVNFISGKKQGKFALISSQRSGSTLLSDYLSSHGEIYMARELFKVSGEGRNVDDDSYRFFKGSVDAFLDAFFESKLKDAKMVGFKIMGDQLLALPEVLSYLKKHKVTCIYLERKNVLKTYVSRMSARNKALYHTEKEIKKQRIMLDPQVILKELNSLSESLKQLRDNIKLLPVYTVYYEDLVNNKELELKGLQKYLNVNETHDLCSKLIKINSNDLNYVISNYSDIFKMIKNTEYEILLDPLKNLPRLVNVNNELQNVIFVHIPKVAGSSIESTLFGTKGKVGHKTALEYYNADKQLYQELFSFAFVRNPYDRLVSAYIYLKNGGRNQYDKAWSDEHLSEFNSFNDFVLSLTNEDKCRDILSWNHFIPQYLFVCNSKNDIMVDFVGRYENLEDQFKIVQKFSNNANQLPHNNKTERNDYQHYYNEKTRAIVRSVYANDFELFHYDSDEEVLKDFLLKVVENNTLIIVFANIAYLKVLENWLEAVSRLEIKNFVIISLDKEIYEVMKTKGVNTILRTCQKDLGNLWIHRINVIKEISVLGFDIVHSDADAVWIKNPMQEYVYDQTFDLVFSQGTYWPNHVHEVFKFVLCCGFFYIKSNIQTFSFLKQIALDVLSTKDDQVSCNQYMLQNNITWNLPENTYTKSFRQVKFVCSNELITGSNEFLSIAVLPHSKFQRIKDDDSDVYVKHLMSEKKSDNIIRVLKDNKCWFLNK